MKNNRRNTKRMLSGRILYYIVWLMVLASCATRMNSAPIFDLSKSFEDLTKLPSDKKNPVTPVSSSLPGLYRVKPGDTLYRIALENKESYQNLIEWNNIENPSRIEINQLLRITPPDNPVTTHVTSVIPYTSEDISSPLLTKNGHSTVFMWPTCGKVINSFDGLKNKGIDIVGIAGQPIRAVANGRVVYAGNSLRGYGNLIIIKHDDIYLTAYAHNHVLVAKEGDIVLMGQKIAEMGDSDANHVMLHFEVRRCGKPVDPLKYISRP